MVGSAAQQVTLAPPGRRYQPGALLRWLYRRFFAKLSVDAAFEETVQGCAQRGTVVYILRSLSFLDYACLNFFADRLALPAIRFVNDLGQLPFRSLWRWLVYRLGRRVPEDRGLREVVQAGESAVLFLKRPPHSFRAAPRGLAFPIDHIEVLVGLQRTTERPIFLVPQTFIWGKRPERIQRSLIDAVFGPKEWPGRVRMALQFVFNFPNAILRVGRPLDLSAFVHANLTEPNIVIASKVRFALLKRLERERRVILGPPLKSPDRIRMQILRSTAVRQRIAEVARIEKKPVTAVEKRARKYLREIEARMRHWVIVLLDRLLAKVWDFIFAGIDVESEGLTRVRDASRHGPLILLPSHKSHIDYLVLSQVFYSNDLAPPHIAAGVNLSFFPLGAVFRRAGAFFLRRTFSGNALYATVFKAYVRQLLLEEHPVEFFIEGTRSRTGKVLPPRHGLLRMVVDAARELPQKSTQLVPVSITYDRIVEERSYLRELSGAEKRPEGIAGLLSTPRVLRARYGRLHIHFGEIIDLAAFLRQAVPDSKEAEVHAESARRECVEKLGHQVVYEIAQATAVTASALLAMALLSHTRRGMDRFRLLSVIERLCSELEVRGAHFAGAVRSRDGRLRTDSVDEGIALFEEAGLLVVHGRGDDVIYQVPSQRRLALDYYKNNVLHHFVPAALVAAALPSSGAMPIDVVAERVKDLSRLFKYEFMFRADRSFDEILAETLSSMSSIGQLAIEEGKVQPLGDAHLLYVGLISNFIEGYRLAVRSLEYLVMKPLLKKELIRRALELGERLYLAGGIERAEALSKPILENAFDSLADRGVLEGGRTRGPCKLSEAYAEPGAIVELENRIAAYLRT